MTRSPIRTQVISSIRRLAISLIAALALIVWVGAASAAGGGTLSGVFTITYGDADPQSGGPNQTVFRLFDNQGAGTTLNMDESLAEPYGGVQALVGRRVRVTVKPPTATSGAAAAPAGGSQTVTVAGIAPEAPPAGAAALPAAAVSGNVAWINILCKFADSPSVEPFPPSYFDGLFSAPTYGITDFWTAQSYGAINVTGATSPGSGWYTLPKTHAGYMNGSWANLDLLAKDCTGVADADVNFTQYAGINLMFNANLDGYSWGGQEYVSADGAGVRRMTWEAPFGYENLAPLAHEIGHGLGLRHSNNFDGDGDPYDNAWDLMSDLWNNCPLYDPDTNPTGCTERGTISYHLDYLGWISAGRKFTASSSAVSTITIDALDLQPADLEAGAYQMAQINISSSEFYTIEVRKKEGPYDSHLPGSGVIIHQVRPSRSEPAWVVGSWSGSITTTGAIFSPGTTFTIPNRYVIRVDSATAKGYVVTIVPAVTPAAPLTISPSGLGSSHTPTFQWTPIPAADRYQLVVMLGRATIFGGTYTSAEASCGSVCTVSGSSIPAGPYLADGKYKFTVTSANAYFTGKTSKARGFTVDTTPPDAPRPLKPTFGSIVRKGLALSASKVRTGVRYQVAISGSADCSAPFLTTGELRSPKYKPSGLPFGTYSWCARARDFAGNWSAFGTAGIFTYAPPIPKAPKQLGPASKASLADGLPVFSWGAVSSGVTYRLEIAYDSGFQSLADVTIQPDTARTPGVSLAPGTYYWRVTALNAFDEPGKPSKTRVLTITAPAAGLVPGLPLASLVWWP